MTDLAEFLLARIAEDEADALAASVNPRPGGTVHPVPPGGEHWRWEFTGGYDGTVGDGITDQPVDLDTDAEYLNEDGGWSPVRLCSVERYPWGGIPGDGPHFVIGQVGEIRAAVARHIARHDPARVLADCAAKRAIVKLHRPEERTTGYRHGDPIREWLCPTCGSACPDEDMGGNLSLVRWQEPAPCRTLLALAQPHADHPRFEPTWRTDR